MDTDTRGLLAGSIRDLLAGGEDIVSGLEELGWSDVVDDDPAAAIDLLFTEQGVTGTASSALDTVAVVGLDDGAVHRLVHPVCGTFAARVDGANLLVDGVVLGAAHGDAVVVAADGAGYVVSTAGPDVHIGQVGGFSPESALRRVNATVDLGSVDEVRVDWTAVSAAARLALAAELVGNATGMLNLATEQISDRRQFGRPIGANQSPRHRLAEGYALVRGAAELVKMAWHTGTAADALTAKAYAGRASDTAGRACLQVCGAIGLTTEHGLPRYVKRARVLDALYGGWQLTTRQIGTQIATASRVPTNGRL